jgi:hypothetical protein
VTGLDVDGLSFDFPEDWQAVRYDGWGFYRNHWSRMFNNIKALDILALDPQRTVWLIEVKDYRVNARTKPSELGEEVARKVFDTLAALLPAKVNATTLSEKKFAAAISRARDFRVILHLEQPRKHSKLRPRAINPADIKLKLRKLLKPVDAHPVVAELEQMGNLPWTVR